MRSTVANILLGVFLLTVSSSILSAQTAKSDNTLKGKYHSIEVVKFEVDPDVDIPSNQINVIWLEVVDELYKLKKFERITKTKAATIANPNIISSLRLQGTIAKYNALVPQKYTTEGGDIWTRVKVKIKFVDASDDSVLLEKEIDRRVFFGMYQFYLGDVGRKVAKEVAKITKTTFF
jgi:hypothetical protein